MFTENRLSDQDPNFELITSPYARRSVLATKLVLGGFTSLLILVPKRNY